MLELAVEPLELLAVVPVMPLVVQQEHILVEEVLAGIELPVLAVPGEPWVALVAGLVFPVSAEEEVVVETVEEIAVAQWLTLVVAAVQPATAAT